MARNPFVYGVVVTGDDFVDREDEIETLHKELSSGKSIVLYSQRRLGKTSLIMEFIARKGHEITPIYIDLYGMTTKEDLAKHIVNGVVNASYTSLERIKKAIGDFFTHLRPKLVVSPDGKATVEFEVVKTFREEELAEILDFPQRVAMEKKKRMILIFDEFQEITMMDGVGLEKLMRSRFQHHRDVSYVFAGSKEHLLRQMFEERARAFFKFSRPMSLGPIPKDEFSSFISKKFKLGGGSVSDEVIDKVLTYTEGHPYFTQYLCHEVWYITKSPKKEKVIDEAIQNILAQQGDAFVHIWDELKSRNQRALLVAIGCEGEHNYSPEFIEKYRLKSQSHVEKSLQLLKNRGLLDDDGRFIDIFFREWVVRTMQKG